VPLERLGSFGAKLVWIGPQRCPERLAELSRAVRAGLDALAVGYDAKRFFAHVTLVRGARALDGTSLTPLDAALAPTELGECGVHLAQSLLLPVGSRYRWFD
jgi:2'-5' RNA ligase